MTKEDFKKSVIIGVVCGITIVITIYSLAIAYERANVWYRNYQRELAEEMVDSIPPDRRGGSFCPECKSIDVGRYVYGYWNPDADSTTAKAVRSGVIIYGGSDFRNNYPKFRCYKCNYKWGNFK